MLAVLNDEQAALRDVAQRLAESVAVRNPSDLPGVDRAAVWSRLAETGLLGLRMREDGAPVASGTEVRLVAEVLAGALVPVPFVSATLAMELLAAAGAAEDIIDGLASGTVRYGVGLRRNLGGLAGPGEVGAVGWDLDGGQYAVALGDEVAGAVSVVRVPVDADAIVPSGVDATRSLAVLECNDAEQVGQVSLEDLVRWEALALALVSADAVGAMRQTLATAVTYSKERVAYGVPIGSFQALQHLMVDAFVSSEPAGSLAAYAAWAVDVLDAPDALVAARNAKAYSSKVGLQVAEAAMQVFGGIGVTREHIAHFYTRRLMVDRHLFGSEDLQLSEIANARLVVN